MKFYVRRMTAIENNTMLYGRVKSTVTLLRSQILNNITQVKLMFEVIFLGNSAVTFLHDTCFNSKQALFQLK